MRSLARGLALAGALFVGGAVLVAVLASPAGIRRGVPHEPYRPDRCTWACHNHGCRHRSRLPRSIAGERGLYGATIAGLAGLGRALRPDDPGTGYRAVNLLIYCVAWPSLTVALFAIAWARRRGGDA
jgi:hypothetical protein